ncbi:MAG: AHH domain-containing protein [Syntrophales bacterium]|jgi:hypothetical protein
MKKALFLFIIFVLSISFLTYPDISCAGKTDIIKRTVEKVFKKSPKKAVKGGSSPVLATALGISNRPGWAAHHIIPVQLRNHRALNKISFDLDAKKNGIALPTKSGMHPTLPIHAGSHPKYTAAVATELDKIPKGLNIVETEKRVDAVIKNFKKKLEAGTPLHKLDDIKNPWKQK